MLLSVSAVVDLSAYAQASANYGYDINDDGTAVISDYTGAEENIVIPSKIDGYCVTGIGDCAFRDCSSLISITIPDSVTSIDVAEFSNCSSLTSATIGNCVTSIGGYVFGNCSNLTSITIQNRVAKIDGTAFYKCSGLTDVYYVGTPEQWNKINFDCEYNYNSETLEEIAANDGLSHVKMHYKPNTTTLKSLTPTDSIRL